MLEKGHVGRALQIVATHPYEFLLAGVLLGAFTIASLGLLFGPAAGGVAAMALKRCRNEDLDVADAFRGFENFTATFLVGLAQVGMVVFGSIFLLVPGLILAALFLYALPIAVDRPVSAGEALKAARRLGAKDLLAQVIFTAVVGALAVSGAVFLLVGLCVTIPIALTAVTVAYHDAAYPPRIAPGAEGAGTA